MRDYLAHVTQFVYYIEDAVACPDLVDFVVVLKKAKMIHNAGIYIERMIGIRRDLKEGARENGTSRTEEKNDSGAKGARRVPAHCDTDHSAPLRGSSRTEKRSETYRTRRRG